MSIRSIESRLAALEASIPPAPPVDPDGYWTVDDWMWPEVDRLAAELQRAYPGWDLDKARLGVRTTLGDYKGDLGQAAQALAHHVEMIVVERRNAAEAARLAALWEAQAPALLGNLARAQEIRRAKDLPAALERTGDPGPELEPWCDAIPFPATPEEIRQFRETPIRGSGGIWHERHQR